MRKIIGLMGITLGMVIPFGVCAGLAGLGFYHKDWQLVCDNTRTCRAAGYSADGDELPVSVLLVRKAGPRQGVAGQLMIGEYGENPALDKLPDSFKLTLLIDQKAQGELTVQKNTLVADLSPPHVQTLLAALVRKNSTIEWVSGEFRWHLSEQGAAAVLLKMDEFQGRIGTKGALVRKGLQSESAVLPALPIPVVQAAQLAKPQPEDKNLLTQHGKALREALLHTATGNEECPQLAEPVEGAEEPITLTRLTNTKLLASTSCWMGAYNWGSGFWVIKDKPPFQPVLVTTSASGFSDGTISTSMKGRGLGDCWSSEEWTWDGRQFVHTESSTTGMCRLLAPGGAWSLPQIVTQVRQPKR